MALPPDHCLWPEDRGLYRGLKGPSGFALGMTGVRGSHSTCHPERSACPERSRSEGPFAYCKSTSVRSTNHDCGETNPLTFLLKARGLRSWTMKSQGGLSTSRSCAIAKYFWMVASSVASDRVFITSSNLSSLHCSQFEPVGEELATAK